MKPVVLGAVGLFVFAAAIAAVFVFLDDGGGRNGQRVPAAPTAAGPVDSIQLMLVEAERLLNRGKTPAAKDAYGKARAQAKRQNNLLGEAAAAFGLGRLEHFNGQSAAARTAFTEALALYGQANDAGGQARVQVAFGDLEKDTFWGAQAAEHYRAAREQWAELPEPKTDPHVVLNMDRAPTMPVGEARARAVLDQADKIFHNIGDVEAQGDVAMLFGALEWNLGKPGAASAAFQSARMLYAQAGLASKEADAALNTARFEILQGYNIAAAESLAAAAQLWQGDAIGMARIAAAQGQLERLQGRTSAAKAALAKAAPALTAADFAGALDVQVQLAAVQRAEGDAAAARATLEAALAQQRRRTDAMGEATARLELGVLLQLMGEANAAKPHLTAAVDVLRGKSALAEARGALALAEIAGVQNDRTVATTMFQRAGDLFADAGAPFGLVLTALSRGDAARAAGVTADAVAAYRQAAEVRAGLGSPLVEASRLLGLPPVGQVHYIAVGEETYDENPPDPAIVRAAQATRAANLAAFPEANAEARTLLKDTDARLAAVAEFARRAN